MLVKGRRKLSYPFSKISQIKLLYQKLGHILNTNIIKVFKLTNSININNNQ